VHYEVVPQLALPIFFGRKITLCVEKNKIWNNVSAVNGEIRFNKLSFYGLSR